MEFRIIKCSACGSYLGKVRVIDVSDGARFTIEMSLKCKNFGRCALAADPKKRGENVIDFKTKT
jgi:hypothetical protein